MTDKEAKNNCMFLMAFALAVIFIGSIAGCMDQPQRSKAAENSFTNMSVVAKSTHLNNQFIVRCSDGSIWELMVSETGYITYKQCLFDPTVVPVLEK